MNSTIVKRSGLAAVALTMSLGMAACGSSTTTDSGTSSTPQAESTPSDSSGASASTSGTFGSACSSIPKSGAGSFQGMSTAPVATAASANPVLSTLVKAVSAAGLVDTLNSAQDITVFAPANAAFAKIPAKDLKTLLANKAELTKVLTHHVVAGKLTPEQLAGDHETLNKDSVTVKGSGENFTVGGANAKVICGNIQTANATVYVIDGVLTPGN